MREKKREMGIKHMCVLMEGTVESLFKILPVILELNSLQLHQTVTAAVNLAHEVFVFQALPKARVYTNTILQPNLNL